MENMYTLKYIGFNLFIPKSDQHLVSHHNITPEYVRVTRIKEMITNEEALDC